MPNRVQWNPDYSVGNDKLDRLHKAILAQCNALANCLADASAQGNLEFHDTLGALMDQAREHFAAEEALLTQCAYPLMEELRNEHDEFDYLAKEIITMENFERIEIQRFLTLWWVGHIVGSGKKYRACLETLPTA